MKLSQFTYLLSVVLFCGPIMFLVWKRNAKLLKKHELALLILVAMSIPIALTDWVAIRWGAWEYLPQGSLQIQYGAEVESYFFAIFVTVLVASITLVKASRVDKKLSQKSKLEAFKRRTKRSKHAYARN